MPTRSDVAVDNPIPVPCSGDRVVKGIQLTDYSALLDERATFMGQWGLRGSRGDGPSYDELVETEGRPRLRAWLERLRRTACSRQPLLRLLPMRQQGRRPDRAARGWQRAAAFHLPAAAPGPAPVPVRLLPARGIRGDRRRRLSPGDDGLAGVAGFGGAVRAQCLPRLPRAAWPVGSAHRGAGGVLARASPGRVGRRPRGRRRSGRDLPAVPGSRYSFGYPACPNLEDRAKIVELLRTGSVSNSEEFQLHPEQSTDALIVHHPEAKYFNAT